MGEEWLPERLMGATLNADLLFLQFDNVPEDIQGEEEGRGFVEHEIRMIKERFEHLLQDDCDTKTKVDAIVTLFLLGHELSSAEVIELLEQAD